MMGVACGDDFKSFAKQIPQRFILHAALGR